MKIKLIGLIVILILITGFIIYLESAKTSSPSENPSLDFEQVSYKFGQFQLAPELQGIAGYINTDENLKLANLRGKVVLIDFWTYSCINCIRTLPHLTAWDKKYRDQGLVIIGVHSPEFEFEHDYNNVKEAVLKYNIEYPVVLDNNFETWRAYKNKYWPHKFLIDSQGYIRYDHIGEGAYEETEMKIQDLLQEINNKVDQELLQLEDKTPNKPLTPELYAGASYALPRGQNLGNEQGLQPGKIIDYMISKPVNRDKIYLKGDWLVNPENLVSMDNIESSIYLNFTASSVNIVAGTLDKPLQLEVYINGKPIGKIQAGQDVFNSNILIDEPRLYNVFNGEYGNYLLELKTKKNFYFNAFTFG